MHALSTHDQRHLLLDDPDHSRATLLVRRAGKPVHITVPSSVTGPAGAGGPTAAPRS
ncbi:hypothetical protein [Streptomyces sviceus]|uniref:hypothetical protein n=1 Tax=Streptomyces sviceus TaxID=285530 RepID=UPI0036E04384